LIIDAFRVFDESKFGHISATTFRNIMLNMGDSLDEETADWALQNANVGTEGDIYYVIIYVKKI
jgi:Ca2+-binding EF-hand superfamily protein